MNRLLTLVMVVALATGVAWGQDKKTAKGKKAEPVAMPKPTPPKGPETFQVEFKTTCGDFVIEVTRKWAPVGADRRLPAVPVGHGHVHVPRSAVCDVACSPPLKARRMRASRFNSARAPELLFSCRAKWSASSGGD